MNTPALQRAVFLLLLTGVTVAFCWVISPFFGAVFWAMVLTLMFMPLQRRLCVALRGRATLAAVGTLLICLLIVVVPLILIIGAMVDEAASFSQRVRGGGLDLRAYFQQVVDALPAWVHGLMGRFGLVSLGHGGFMGVGAYVTALLWNHLGVSPWIGIPVSMAAAGILALVVAYPCFRFRITGHYFVLVTLALSGIVLQVITATRLNFSPVLMAAANSSGGVMGKMISLQSIAVAAAATGLDSKKESALFRLTLRHSVILAALIGLITMLYAYTGWAG